MIEESYYAEVESHFVERRGSPLFISPDEWHLVYQWEQMGVPLEVVKEGIDRVFERPKTRVKPRKLGYCRQTVLAAFRRFREAGVGGGAPPPAGDQAVSLASHLEDLGQALRRAADESGAVSETLVATLADVAERVLRLAPALDQGRLGEVETSLADLDRILVSGSESAVGESTREELRREAESSLEPYRERMPPKVYQAALESAYRRRIRKRLGVPVLSLNS